MASEISSSFGLDAAGAAALEEVLEAGIARAMEWGQDEAAAGTPLNDTAAALVAWYHNDRVAGLVEAVPSVLEKRTAKMPPPVRQKPSADVALSEQRQFDPATAARCQRIVDDRRTVCMEDALDALVGGVGAGSVLEALSAREQLAWKHAILNVRCKTGDLPDEQSSAKALEDVERIVHAVLTERQIPDGEDMPPEVEDAVPDLATAHFYRLEAAKIHGEDARAASLGAGKTKQQASYVFTSERKKDQEAAHTAIREAVAGLLEQPVGQRWFAPQSRTGINGFFPGALYLSHDHSASLPRPARLRAADRLGRTLRLQGEKPVPAEPAQNGSAGTDGPLSFSPAERKQLTLGLTDRQRGLASEISSSFGLDAAGAAALEEVLEAGIARAMEWGQDEAAAGTPLNDTAAAVAAWYHNRWDYLADAAQSVLKGSTAEMPPVGPRGRLAPLPELELTSLRKSGPEAVARCQRIVDDRRAVCMEDALDALAGGVGAGSVLEALSAREQLARQRAVLDARCTTGVWPDEQSSAETFQDVVRNVRAVLEQRQMPDGENLPREVKAAIRNLVGPHFYRVEVAKINALDAYAARLGFGHTKRRADIAVGREKDRNVKFAGRALRRAIVKIVEQSDSSNPG